MLSGERALSPNRSRWLTTMATRQSSLRPHSALLSSLLSCHALSRETPKGWHQRRFRQCHLWAPKMVDYLETIGMDSGDALDTAAEVDCLAVKPRRNAVFRGLSERGLPPLPEVQLTRSR